MPTVRELLTKYSIDATEAFKGLEKIDRGLQSLKRTAQVVGTAVLAGAGALWGMADAAQRHIDVLDETAQSVGMTTQAFARLAAATQLGGAEMGDTAAAVAKLQQNIAAARAGNADAAKSFRSLGVSMADLKTLSVDQIIGKLADGLKGTEDPAQRVALAVDVLGRGGRKLLPSMMEGAAGLKAAGDQLERFGGVPSAEAIKAAGEMEKSMARAKHAVGGLALQVGSALMPVVSEIAGGFAEWVQTNRELIKSKITAFINGLKTAISLAWKVASSFFGALGSILGWMTDSPLKIEVVRSALVALVAAMAIRKVLDFASGLGALIPVIKAVGMAMWANPMLAILGLIAVALMEVVANWDSVKAAVEGAVTAIQNVLAPVGQWIQDYLIGPLEEFINMLPGGGDITDGITAVDRLKEQVDAAGAEQTGDMSGLDLGPPSDSSWPMTMFRPQLTPGAGAPGARNVSVRGGPITVNVAGSSASAADISGEVRRTVRQEWDAIAREAALDVAG